MHERYDWEQLLDFARFNADPVYCPCLVSLGTDSSNDLGIFFNNKKCTRTQEFIDVLKKELAIDDTFFSLSDVYLRTYVIGNKEEKYIVDYFAPIWKGKNVLLHVSSSSVYDSENNTELPATPYTFEVYYNGADSTETEEIRVDAKGFKLLTDDKAQYDIVAKRRVFQTIENANNIPSDLEEKSKLLNNIITKLYNPYILTVKNIIAKNDETLKNKIENALDDSLNKTNQHTIKEWEEILLSET